MKRTTGPGNTANFITLQRREFLRRAVMGSAAFFTVGGAFAEELVRTPRMTEGPYYPDKLPLDTDNDLLILNDKITPAVGEVTHLTGRVLGPDGTPLRNALVEIWQCDNNGNYIHTRGANPQKANSRDGNFQGYGRFSTDTKGQYYFRTIKPVVYPGRAPHIHVAVSQGGKRMLTTQLFVKGHPQNSRDGIYNGIRDAKAMANVTPEFKPVEDSRTGELAASFEIVIGLTPEDPSTDRPPGGPGGGRRGPGGPPPRRPV